MEDVLIKKRKGGSWILLSAYSQVSESKQHFSRRFAHFPLFCFSCSLDFFPSRLGFVGVFFSLNGGIQSLNGINACKNALLTEMSIILLGLGSCLFLVVFVSLFFYL